MRKRSPIPAWLHRLLGQIQGLHLTKNEDNTLTVTLSGDARRRTFEVVPIPVLSKEKASEFIKGRELFAAEPARVPLVATRQLAEQTRELLRKAGDSGPVFQACFGALNLLGRRYCFAVALGHLRLLAHTIARVVSTYPRLVPSSETDWPI